MLGSSILFKKGSWKKNILRKVDFKEGKGNYNPVKHKLEELKHLGYATLGKVDGNSFHELCYGSTKEDYQDYSWGDWN